MGPACRPPPWPCSGGFPPGPPARCAPTLAVPPSPRQKHRDCALSGSQSYSDDAVERALAELEQTVRDCRWNPPPLIMQGAPGHSTDACASTVQASVPHQELPSQSHLTGSTEEPFDMVRPPGCDSHNDRARTADRSTAEGNLGGAACGSDAETAEARAEREALEAEAEALRSELRAADLTLQAVTTEVANRRTAMRAREERHKEWLKRAESAVSKLRLDNVRLEKSEQQASQEERRLVVTIRSEPERGEEALAQLRSECSRLEMENAYLKADLEAGRAELMSVQGVVAKEARMRAKVTDRMTSSPTPVCERPAQEPEPVPAVICTGPLLVRHTHLAT